MKLPFTFGLRLVYRLFLPGLILALGFSPSFFLFFRDISEFARFEWVIVTAVLMLGWLISISDMHIYMIFEGRRYWPNSIKSWFISREERRLQKLLNLEKKVQQECARLEGDYRKLKDDLSHDQNQCNKSKLESEVKKRKIKLNLARSRNAEIAVEIRRFPVDEEYVEEAQYPTRLGNLIAAYEQYPDRAYGADGVFYWYRINLELSNEFRSEIDEMQSAADGTLYSSFSLILVGLVNCLSAGILAWFSQSHGVEPTDATQELMELAVWVLTSGVVVGWVILRVSLHLHASFGEHFKALFDKYLPVISVDSSLEELVRYVDDKDFKKWSARRRYISAWRYLHNYRIKVDSPEGSKLIRPSDHE